MRESGKKDNKYGKDLRKVAESRWKPAVTKAEKKEEQATFTRERFSQSNMLLQEEAGFLEVEDGEKTNRVTQGDIRKAVDITSATKSFDLSLAQYGPYRIDYTLNGRHLLIGGHAGHLACLDWVTKRLLCEINVMEEIYDVSWLHQETMLAAAQKEWVYIYDNQGIELHCIKNLHRTLRLQFLPYHFLLVASNDRGYLSWLDVSVGKMVASMPTRHGRLDIMCQNPSNAVIVLGHSNGTVTMWSPSVREPLLSMLCHLRAIRGVTVDRTGTYMATVSTDSSLKIWDVRNCKCLHSYRMPSSANHVSFSQRNLLAVATGNSVQVYKDSCTIGMSAPYLCHPIGKTVTDIGFCPYEDILGIGHDGGFSSILVPGAGEPNFDALEQNPFQTKAQRRELEVKALLEKIQPEMIVLDPNQVKKIDLGETSTVEKHNSQTNPKQKVHVKLNKKSKTGDVSRRKQAILDEERMKIKRTAALKEAKKQSKKSNKEKVKTTDVFTRFEAKHGD